MWEHEAIEIARAFARQRGHDTALYDVRSKKEGGRWILHFQRKSKDYKPDPGDFFTIYVDDLTKEAQNIIYGK